MLNNQKGIISFLVLVLLLIGITVGIYLVQQKTNYFPEAKEKKIKEKKVSHQLFILEDDDSLEQNFSIQNLTKLFYRKNPDKFDFIQVFPTFYANQQPTGFTGNYSVVQRSVRGICQQVVSKPEDLQTKKLQAWALYPPQSIDYQEWVEKPQLGINVVLEEISHHWLAYAGQWETRPRQQNINGVLIPPIFPPEGVNNSCIQENNLPLLTNDEAHWTEGLQSPDGVMGAMRETKPWIDNGDGTFSYEGSSIDKQRKFHPFDLYLMGFKDAREIKEEFLLLTNINRVNTNPVANSQSAESTVNSPFPSGPPIITPPKITVTADLQKVTIDDLLRITGEPRNPSVKNSQKSFKVAFVIVKKKGEIVPDAVFKAVNQIANEFPKAWAYATDNLSTIK